MKRFILAAIRCSLLFLVPTTTYAISAQWDLNPISGDWNTAANWAPNGVPNGPADTATFDRSNRPGVLVVTPIEVNGIVFNADAQDFTISVGSGLTFTISGAGIMNNSGQMQEFHNFGGSIMFTNSATAGDLTSRRDFLETRRRLELGSGQKAFLPELSSPFPDLLRINPPGAN